MIFSKLLYIKFEINLDFKTIRYVIFLKTKTNLNDSKDNFNNFFKSKMSVKLRRSSELKLTVETQYTIKMTIKDGKLIISITEML